MKSGIENHPAVRLGKFVKDKRIESGLTLRDAAAWLEIDPSKLSNLEMGIGHHINDVLRDEMIHCYCLDCDGAEELVNRSAEVDKLKPLTITDIFDEDDVLPLFIPLNDEQRTEFLRVLGFKK